MVVEITQDANKRQCGGEGIPGFLHSPLSASASNDSNNPPLSDATIPRQPLETGLVIQMELSARINNASLPSHRPTGDRFPS